MRTIKFRAWAWDTRHSDDYEKKLYMLNVECICWDDDGNVEFVDVPYKIDKTRTIEIDDEDVEIMQYTGLKDANGVEIYEGDIVHHEGYYLGDSFIHEGQEVISWGEGGFDNFDGYLTADICKVIGNIYEHPELLANEK